MFENLNGWEIIVLALLGLFIFGPERLPKVIGDAMRTIRNLRDMARNATNDLSRELGTEVRLEDLHPKTFIRKHLLSEDEERELRKPFDDMYQDVRQISSDVSETGRAAVTPAPRSYDDGAYGTYGNGSIGAGQGAPGQLGGGQAGAGQLGTGPSGSAPAGGQSDDADRPGAHRYDADAT